MIAIKRVYEPAAAEDGTRILVDRLWPRGLSKESAAISEWMRALSPSNELRRWYNHDAALWEEFRQRYQLEINGLPEALMQVERLKALGSKGKLTLLYSSKEAKLNNAEALRLILLKPQEK